MFVKKVIVYDDRKRLFKKHKGFDVKSEVVYSFFGLVFYRVLSI